MYFKEAKMGVIRTEAVSRTLAKALRCFANKWPQTAGVVIRASEEANTSVILPRGIRCICY